MNPEHTPSEAGKHYIAMQGPFMSYLLSMGYNKTEEEYVSEGYAEEFERFMQTVKARTLTELFAEELLLKVRSMANRVRDAVRRTNNRAK